MSIIAKLVILPCLILMPLISFLLMGANQLTSFLSLLLLIGGSIYYYQINKVSFFLLIQFFVAFIWCSFSLYYIELGNFISEQKVFGENIGALFRYILYMGLFLSSAYFFINARTDVCSRNYISGNSAFFKLVTQWLFFILVIFCFIIGFLYKFPLFSGMSRFEFYKLIEPLDKVIFLMPISAFMIGILMAREGKIRYLSSIIILIVFLILFSDKFSGIYGVLVYFTMGFYLTKNISDHSTSYGFSRKILFFYFPIIFIFFLTIAAMGYTYLHGASSSDLQDRILSRVLGLQAHVWYGIDFRLYFKLIHFDPSIFLLESNEPIQPAGLEYLMYQIADEKFVDAFREAGIRFTNGYPAIVLISFGYIYSIFILILLGIVLGFFLFYTYQKVKLLQPIRLFISLVFYNNIIINIFIMGEIYYIYKILGLVCFFIILIDILILRHKNVVV